MFQGRKHGFCLCANSPSSNELIGYVDLPDFNEIWPKWTSDINAQSVSGFYEIQNIFPVTC